MTPRSYYCAFDAGAAVEQTTPSPLFPADADDDELRRRRSVSAANALVTEAMSGREPMLMFSNVHAVGERNRFHRGDDDVGARGPSCTRTLYTGAERHAGSDLWRAAGRWINHWR